MSSKGKPLVAFDALLESAIAACRQLRAEVRRMRTLPNGDLCIPRGTRGDAPTSLVLIEELRNHLALCNGWCPSPDDLDGLLKAGVTFEQAIPFENPTIREPVNRLLGGLPKFFGERQPTTLPASITQALDQGIEELPAVLDRWRNSFVGKAKYLVADAVVAVGGSKTPEVVDVSRSTNEFRLEGSTWVVRFGGTQTLVKDSRGMGMLAKLIACPGSGVSSVVLDGTAVVPGVEQELMDDTALKRAQTRLGELRARRARATATEDAALAAGVDVEIAQLTRELKRAQGIGGRSRKLSPDAERACDRVACALTVAINHIKRLHPTAGDHLDRSVVKRHSQYPEYRPNEPKPVWFVSRG